MNTARSGKRGYRSEVRDAAATLTRSKILDAGRFLFSRRGIDATTVAQVAERAGVAEATVYATVRSKAGLLEALMHDALFGERFQRARDRLVGVDDPVQRIALTAHVACAVYQGESADLSLLMKASAFSPALRKTQQRFESLRREMQKERIDALYAAGRARPGLDADEAASILWMLTGRDTYHKMVHESGWAPERFQLWLERTLVETLTDAGIAPG